MAKYKIFFYTVPFQEIYDHLTQRGHLVEPVYHYDTLQHYQVKGTRLVITPEKYAKHPITGDYITTIHAQIYVGFDVDKDTYRRIYDSEDIKLYNHLRRRFGKR